MIRPRRKAASRARHRTNFDTTSDELSLEEEVIQPTQVFLQTQVEEEKEVVEDLHEQSKEDRNCFLPHYSTSLSMSPLARSLETELSQATPPKEKEVVDLEDISDDDNFLRKLFLPHHSSLLARSLETELPQAVAPREKEVVEVDDLEEEINISDNDPPRNSFIPHYSSSIRSMSPVAVCLETEFSQPATPKDHTQDTTGLCPFLLSSTFFFLPSIPVHTPELFSQTHSATHSTSGARRSLHPGQTRTRPTQVRKVYTSSEAEGVTTPNSATQSTSGATLPPGQTRTRPTGQARERTNRVREVYTSSEAEEVTSGDETGERPKRTM